MRRSHLYPNVWFGDSIQVQEAALDQDSVSVCQDSSAEVVCLGSSCFYFDSQMLFLILTVVFLVFAVRLCRLSVRNPAFVFGLSGFIFAPEHVWSGAHAVRLHDWMHAWIDAPQMNARRMHTCAFRRMTRRTAEHTEAGKMKAPVQWRSCAPPPSLSAKMLTAGKQIRPDVLAACVLSEQLQVGVGEVRRFDPPTYWPDVSWRSRRRAMEGVASMLIVCSHDVLKTHVNKKQQQIPETWNQILLL